MCNCKIFILRNKKVGDEMKWGRKCEEKVYGLEVIDGTLPNFINKGTNLNTKRNYKREGPKFKLNCYKSILRSQGGM
jgi:hypothetical protein